MLLELIVIVLITTGLSSSEMRPLKRVCGDETTVRRCPDDLRSVRNVAIAHGGRLIEQYNETLVAEIYGPHFAMVLPGVVHHDQQHFLSVPQKNSSLRGMIGQRVQGSVLQLAKVLARSTESILYETSLNGVDMVIKYQANCIELDFAKLFIRKNFHPYIHPAVVEAFFARQASKFGIGPLIYFFSPPTTLCERKTGICDFTLSSQEYEMCAQNIHASLRFIAIEKISGHTLLQHKRKNHARGIVPVEQALLIGDRLIALIEQLHTRASVVHGDIHAANIMISGTGHNITLKLIDFARASENNIKPEHPVRTPYYARHCLFSPWEILGYTPAPRDDIARAVQVIARLMFPLEYEQHEKALAGMGAKSILRWKLERNFFHYPAYNLLTGITHVNATQAVEFHSQLARVAQLVREWNM